MKSTSARVTIARSSSRCWTMNRPFTRKSDMGMITRLSPCAGSSSRIARSLGPCDEVSGEVSSWFLFALRSDAQFLPSARLDAKLCRLDGAGRPSPARAHPRHRCGLEHFTFIQRLFDPSPIESHRGDPSSLRCAVAGSARNPRSCRDQSSSSRDSRSGGVVPGESIGHGFKSRPPYKYGLIRNFYWLYLSHRNVGSGSPDPVRIALARPVQTSSLRATSNFSRFTSPALAELSGRQQHLWIERAGRGRIPLPIVGSQRRILRCQCPPIPSPEEPSWRSARRGMVT
ncbi:hypothetical protein QFZ29_001497 [Agromyces albus]|nr:hypothetical protein [Agromyces albus]